ncbi:MAG: silent information regulator protein Sir2 [Pirellulales bacterium]|nr:silent information regulator protein Sir2 [Pirellulales bacterium]
MMMRYVLSVAAALMLFPSAASAQMAEKLDRGLVAIRQAEGPVYLGWRLLESDPADATFHVYHQTGQSDAPRRLTAEPVRQSTNFVDAEGASADNPRYFVRIVTADGEGPPSSIAAPPATPAGQSHVAIRLQGDYRTHKVAAGDLDGDGRYELVLQQPDFNTDPYQAPGYWKKSPDTYKLEAYAIDGRFLWRHDMGWSIEAGTWYAPYVVYDLDGDGKAEVYCKGGEGDPREPEGHVKTGPEWLYKLDGQSGQIVKKIPWIGRLPEIGEYNYFCRNMLAVAYLDGRRPHLLMQRGTYRAIVIEAYDPELNLVWRWNSHDEKEKYDSQGAHTIRVADVDGDACDEIIVGSCLVDHDGKAMWTLGIGHPDTCYVGKIDPGRPGLQIFFGIEPRQKSGAVRLVDALSGKTLWANQEPTVHVHAQGMCADILAEHPGQECYAGEAKGGDQAWMYTAQGKRIGSENIGSLAPWTLWWDADPQKEILLKGKLMKFQGETIFAPPGADRAQMVADLLGDWREELVTAIDGELRIYTTTIPAQSRRVCLMQDRLYRLYVATNSMGYNTPPQHSEPFVH